MRDRGGASGSHFGPCGGTRASSPRGADDGLYKGERALRGLLSRRGSTRSFRTAFSLFKHLLLEHAEPWTTLTKNIKTYARRNIPTYLRGISDTAFVQKHNEDSLRIPHLFEPLSDSSVG